MRTRRACPRDVGELYRLIAHYAAEGLLLPRSEAEIHEHIGRFLLLTEKQSSTEGTQEQVLGCVALEPYGADLAEVRSLAVVPQVHGRGLGTRLLRAALAAAKRRRIPRVFAVTHAPDFFVGQGFAAAARQSVPEKIARDCRTCPKSAHCELVAVVATVCPERAALPVLAAAAKAAPAL